MIPLDNIDDDPDYGFSETHTRKMFACCLCKHYTTGVITEWTAAEEALNVLSCTNMDLKSSYCYAAHIRYTVCPESE
jgi:hypothetical protein